jgi:hypothetical protein
MGLSAVFIAGPVSLCGAIFIFFWTGKALERLRQMAFRKTLRDREYAEQKR